MAKASAKSEQVAHYYPGEVIFREGQTDDSIYVIKTGMVDISIIRNEQNIILQTLKAGECFGEMAALLGKERSATATASTYTEVYTFTQKQLNQLMEHVPSVIRQLLMAQLTRLTVANTRAVVASTPSHPLLVASEVIQLHAYGKETEKRDNRLYIKLDVISTSLKRMLGLSDYGVNQLLQKMEKLGLLALVGKKDKEIELRSRHLVEKAEKLVDDVGYDITGQCPSESELIDLETLVAFTSGVRKNILTMLSADEFADSCILFRRSEIVNILNEQGKDFFTRRRIKDIADWSEVDDLQFCDTPTLEKALGRLEPYQLAVLMSSVPEGDTRKRMLNTLSERKKEVLDSFEEDIGTQTKTDVDLIVNELFDKVRHVKEARGGA